MNTIVKKDKPYTLIFLIQQSKVLLGLKKRGFAEGKWNGFGGKVEAGETVVEGAIREMKEECGVTIHKNDLKFKGFFTFNLVPCDQIHRIHVFTAEKFEGEIIETEEMKPQWFEMSQVPYESMWKDDQYWYPTMFEKKLFSTYFKFADSDTIEEYKVEELKDYAELLQIQQENGFHKLE